MAKKLSDFTIISDIDGTLHRAPNPIPQRNIDAVARFVEKGGHFAIASGRSLVSVRQYIDQITVNAPCLVFNGGMVYDYAAHNLIYAHYLPETYKEYTRILMERFPNVGFVLLDIHQLLALQMTEETREIYSIENLPLFDATLDSLENKCLKLLMAATVEDKPALEAFAAAQPWEDVAFISTNANYLEMMPAGINKGEGIRQLTASYGIPHENIIAIGDYYNDYEMLQNAAMPVTVAGAPDDIKAICKLVVGDCMDGAIADLIEYLESKYE